MWDDFWLTPDKVKIEPSSLDKEDLARKNRACSARTILQRVDSTLTEVEHEIHRLERGWETLHSVQSFLNYYVEALESPSETRKYQPWFHPFEMLLLVLKRLIGLSDDAREGVEAELIKSFLALAEEMGYKLPGGQDEECEEI